MACFLALACPGHLHTLPRWELQGRLPGQPNQMLRPGSRHQAATCWGGAKTDDLGARRSGTGFTSFLELEVPYWNADSCGPMCSAKWGGLPVPILCPWWEQQRERTHWASPPSLSSRGSEASPTPFSPRSLCPARPSPAFPQPRLLWDRALGHWTLCTVAAEPRLAGDQSVTLASGSGSPAHARLWARLHVTGEEAGAPETGRDKPKVTCPQTGTMSLGFITVTTTPSPCGGFSRLGTCSTFFLPRPQAPGSCSEAQFTFTEGC